MTRPVQGRSPLVQELAWIPPQQVLQRFAGQPGTVLLDFAAQASPESRYAFLGIDPYRQIHIRSRPQWQGPDSPFSQLDDLLEPSLAVQPDLPPFQGGVIGYLAYEAGNWLEHLPDPKPVTPQLPLMVVACYDLVLAWDRLNQRCWLFSTGLPEQDRGGHERAHSRAAWLAQQLNNLPPLPSLDWSTQSGWQADLSQQAFEARVKQVKAHIQAGDIFQANLTARFTAALPVELNPFDLYRRLYQLSAEPFSAFFNWGSGQILSASPERFLRLDAMGWVETRPIKGTRPRGHTPDLDAQLAQELVNSSKDRAENVMIVDLLRNDLGRVCEIGSIQVPLLCELESYDAVHHLTSQVIGRLRAGQGPIDLLRATFPGGSITGAPKIRSMEIIHDLEPFPRQAYCGTLFWMGHNGEMDASILIRMLQLTEDQGIDSPPLRWAIAQAGCGIVADSDPAAEYAEMQIKVAPLLASLSGRAGPPGDQCSPLPAR
jgi:para-aminobenzoate synthetase component I